MTTRINHLIDYLGFTQTQFAEHIGIAPASMTHIIKGRNKPSLDVISKILLSFEQVSPDWLLFGQGDMVRGKKSTIETSKQAEDNSREPLQIKEVPKPVRYITVFYDDDTYCTFYPK